PTLRAHPTPPPFPYTTLFRSLASGDTIILTFQNAVVAKAVSAAEFYGIVALDQTATAIGNSLTPSSGLTAPTTSPNELLYGAIGDRKSTRLNSSHQIISYAVF